MAVTSFLKPIGSVVENDTGTTKVRGTYGSVRHIGVFSDDNPYLAQLLVANKNQDKDALYQQAVEAEADRSQDLWELDVNRQLRDEEREYNLPVNELARQREAGINPDVSGGVSGSGSGSATSVPYISGTDVNSTPTYYNSYDNTSKVFEGMNATANVITAVTNFISGMNGLHEAVSTFQDRKSFISSEAKIRNTDAEIASATKTNVIDSHSLQNQDMSYRNHLSKIQQLGELCSMLPKDATDEDIISFLSDLGYSESESVPLSKGMSRYMKTPQMQDFHNRNQIRANESEGSLPYLDVEHFNTLSGFQSQLDIDSKQTQALISAFNLKVAQLTTTDSNASNIAEGELMKNSNQVLEQKLRKSDLQSYITAIDKKMKDRARIYNQLEKEKQSIKDFASKRPQSYVYWGSNSGSGELTSTEKTRILQLELQQMMLSSQSNAELNQIYSIASQAYSTSYLVGSTIDVSGHPLPTSGNRKYEFTNAAIFSNYTSQVSEDETNLLMESLRLLLDL